MTEAETYAQADATAPLDLLRAELFKIRDREERSLDWCNALNAAMAAVGAWTQVERARVTALLGDPSEEWVDCIARAVHAGSNDDPDVMRWDELHELSQGAFKRIARAALTAIAKLIKATP